MFGLGGKNDEIDEGRETRTAKRMNSTTCGDYAFPCKSGFA